MRKSESVGCDYAVVGGGVVGLCVAMELRAKHPSASITLFEKESSLGKHASTRNSGVLHAGFYYTADSLKAKFCREGNRYWTEFCREHKLKINSCGKLVVAQNEADLQTLDILRSRAEKNGVLVRMLNKSEVQAVEPLAKTYQKALYSPTTATVDSSEVMNALERIALQQGIAIQRNTKIKSLGDGRLLTEHLSIEVGHIFNCAGLYSDELAREMQLNENYRILPFKGLYLKSLSSERVFKTHIYPVPNLENPFLGVHITLGVDGKVKLGPTAIPALWREQYQGLKNFNVSEFLEIGFRHLNLICTGDRSVRKLAFQEVLKYFKKKIHQEAGKLAHGINPNDFTEWSPPGIRAQLVDMKTKKLEMDFVIKKTKHTTHVLNAVSPGFTCAVPFAKYICEEGGV